MPKYNVTITKTYEINADTRISAIDFVRNNESVITPTHIIKNAVVVGSELLPSVTPSVSLTDLPTDFATKVKVSGDDHWVWVGRNASFRSSAGHKITYGKYSVPKQDKRYFAHRYAYDQLLGAITNKTLLINHCGNTLCVNPTHWGKKTNLLERGVCSQGHYQNDKVTTYTIKGRPACRKCQVNGNAKNKGRSTIPFPPETPVN
jgi:hypothetical protein